MKKWPVFVGDFKLGNAEGWVAVATLNTKWEDMEELLKLECVAIIGSVKTENLGVEKIIANIISNSNIRYLVICGRESKGHYPGDALLCLLKHGVNDEGRIINAKGAIPYIENVSREHVEHFRKQIVKAVDLREVEDVERIRKEIENLCQHKPDVYEEGPIHLQIEKVSEASNGELCELTGPEVFLNELTEVNTITFKAELINQEG